MTVMTLHDQKVSVYKENTEMHLWQALGYVDDVWAIFVVVWDCTYHRLNMVGVLWCVVDMIIWLCVFNCCLADHLSGGLRRAVGYAAVCCGMWCSVGCVPWAVHRLWAAGGWLRAVTAGCGCGGM